MRTFVALLRAVNVGGTGALAMSALEAMCADCGFVGVRTYIASGNAVFASDLDEADVRARLEARLLAHFGKPVGALVRTRREMADVLAANPFADQPGKTVTATFLNAAPSPAILDDVRHRANERIALGARELYIHYPDGMARSKLVIPAARSGTARNMNTVGRLVAMAGE